MQESVRSGEAAAQPEGGSAQPPAPVATGAVLRKHVVQLVEGVMKYDEPVRHGADDAVHQMRVMTRRLRSVLASYAPILGREQTEPLREELRWFAGELAEARDCEVLRRRLEALMLVEPSVLLPEPVVVRVESYLGDRECIGRARAEAALADPRYGQLLADLAAFATDPPLLPAASAPAHVAIPLLLASQARRLKQRIEAVDAAPDAFEADLALHEVRKAAKRVRYAADSATDFLGATAGHLSRRAESIQDVLGEHHDTAVVRAVLRQLASEAGQAGEDAAPYERLHGVEATIADQLRTDYLTLLPW